MRLLLALLVGASCNKSDPDRVAELEQVRDRACACRDRACISAVEPVASKYGDRDKLTFRERTIVDATNACIDKFLLSLRAEGASTPPRDAGVSIDAPPPEPPKPEVPEPATADALLTAARAWQQALHPGLSPWEIHGAYIEADGKLDPEHGYFIVEYRFLADLTDDPRRKTGAPIKPSGARPTLCPKLRFQRGEWQIREAHGGCRDVTTVPKCTLASIWKRGLAAGAPAEALATVSYYGQISRWRFAITDKPRGVDIDRYYADDCKIVVEKP